MASTIQVSAAAECGLPYAGTLLVDAGGERISYRRARPSSCYSLTYFSDETRHHILAEMLRGLSLSVMVIGLIQTFPLCFIQG